MRISFMTTQNKGITNDLLTRANSATEASSFLKRKPQLKKTGNQYTLKIINKKSCHYPDLYFTNMIGERNQKCKYFKNSRSQVSNFLRKDNKVLTPEEMPFHRLGRVDINRKSNGKRIQEIFKLEKVPLETPITKADYLPPHIQRNSPKEKNNLFRIFFTIDPDSKTYLIYLLDPYHLLATSKYHDNYLKAKNFHLCMSTSTSLVY